MEDIHLSPEATVLASRIRTIDRDVDSLDKAARDSVISGLHNSGAAMAGNIILTASDRKRADLLAERADLVQQLKILVGDDPVNGPHTGAS